jgi:hypothetical protein
MSEEIAGADALLTENAELRAELLRRAEMDAEDTHRLQAYCDRLYRENEQLMQRLADAHRLLGRLDYFLETYAAQPELIRARQAAQLRREIAALTTDRSGV